MRGDYLVLKDILHRVNIRKPKLVQHIITQKGNLTLHSKVRYNFAEAPTKY